MKHIILAAVIALCCSCDTAPAAPTGTSSDAGAQALPSPQVINPVGGIGGPGGVPSPIGGWCLDRLRACDNLCRFSYGGWCPWCTALCYDGCDREYALCVWM